MKKPTRRNARVPAVGASNEASTLPKLDTASLSEIIHALANGRITATSLTKFYLSRIEACDRGGLMLNSRAISTAPSRRSTGRWRASRCW
jgi:amidase